MKRALGIALQNLALVVLIQFVATQLYDSTLEGTGMAVWRVLDPIMVLGALVAVMVAFNRKRPPRQLCQHRPDNNLDIMRGINSESFDLNYLHPPFNPNQGPLCCRRGLQTRVRQSSSSAFPPYHFNPYSLVGYRTFRHASLSVPPRLLLQKKIYTPGRSKVDPNRCFFTAVLSDGRRHVCAIGRGQERSAARVPLPVPFGLSHRARTIQMLRLHLPPNRRRNFPRFSPLNRIALVATFITSPALLLLVRRNWLGEFSEPIRTKSIPACAGNSDCLHRATNKKENERFFLLHGVQAFKLQFDISLHYILHQE